MRDVWVTIGNAFMELQAYDQAIDSFGRAINPPWHLHRLNPVVHQEIVNAYEAKGDTNTAREYYRRVMQSNAYNLQSAIARPHARAKLEAGSQGAEGIEGV